MAEMAVISKQPLPSSLLHHPGFDKVPAGLEMLANVNALYVLNKFDRRFVPWNRFEISTNGQPILTAAEDENDARRGGQMRDFTFHIKNASGHHEVLTIKRSDSSVCCCLGGDGDHLQVETPSDGVIGHIKTKATATCSKRFAVLDEAGTKEKLYVIKPGCIKTGCASGNDFEVFAHDDGSHVGQISTPAFNRRNMTSYNLTFPVDLDVKLKALLLAASFLFDVAFFSR